MVYNLDYLSPNPRLWYLVTVWVQNAGDIFTRLLEMSVSPLESINYSKLKEQGQFPCRIPFLFHSLFNLKLFGRVFFFFFDDAGLTNFSSCGFLTMLTISCILFFLSFSFGQGVYYSMQHAQSCSEGLQLASLIDFFLFFHTSSSLLVPRYETELSTSV